MSFFMNYELLQQLKQWRDEQARIEGVETYRVMNNATLEALIARMPTNPAELLEVKGIKEAKSRRYGKALLGMIATFGGGTDEGDEANVSFGKEARTLNQESGEKKSEERSGPEEPLTVSQFLDSLNVELSGMAARLCGEVSSVDVRERVVYFTLKDSADESLLNCLIFRYQYEVSGVKLAIGDEVIVEGAPDIYKPSGRLSLKVGVIEYAGEGALKKAYDALYQKLETAGAFAAERKRPIPEFSQTVALITSREGAAIGDFTMNLVRAGMKVDFYPTLVEGKKAVFEIIEAIRFFNRTPERYDVLVIIRGGGSLESLQAFNTEALVEAVLASRIPILAGIGHERDVSLAALAADAMVSTPTATARALSGSWDEARVKVGQYTLSLERSVQQFQTEIEKRIRNAEDAIRLALESVSHRMTVTHTAFREVVAVFPEQCRRLSLKLTNEAALWQMRIQGALKQSSERLTTIEDRLRQFDPIHALRFGYAIVRKAGRIVRGTDGIVIGDRIDIQLGRGSIESEITGITEHI